MHRWLKKLVRHTSSLSQDCPNVPGLTPEKAAIRQAANAAIQASMTTGVKRKRGQYSH